MLQYSYTDAPQVIPPAQQKTVLLLSTSAFGSSNSVFELNLLFKSDDWVLQRKSDDWRTNRGAASPRRVYARCNRREKCLVLFYLSSDRILKRNLTTDFCFQRISLGVELGSQ